MLKQLGSKTGALSSPSSTTPPPDRQTHRHRKEEQVKTGGKWYCPSMAGPPKVTGPSGTQVTVNTQLYVVTDVHG